MKRFLIIICMLLLPLQPARAQGLFLGFGLGDMEIIRIGASARKVLHQYLSEDYRRNCAGKKKKLAEDCFLKEPYYTSSALPHDAVYRRIPEDVMQKIGFIQPGTVYMQIGYTVYLVRWPNKIIYDHVTLWEDDE